MDTFGYHDVQIHHKAVWDSDGSVTFMAEGGAGGRVEDSHLPGRVYKQTPCIRLRNFLEERKIDFLKIDIEGAEYRVLKDCADRLDNIEHLFVEYHSMQGQSQDLHEILRLIHDAGFRYHIKQAYTTSFPYLERVSNYGMDLQLNIFAYRE